MAMLQSVTVAFLDDDATEPRQMRVGPGLATLLAVAARVNEGKDPFAISFTSLFIGLIASPDETGEWVRAQFAGTSADLSGFLRRRGLTENDREKLTRAAPAMPHPTEPLTRTGSGRQALEEAERRARQTSSVPGTAQLLAAFVSLQGFHDTDFSEHNIVQNAWLAAFEGSPLGEQVRKGIGEPDFDPRAPGVELQVLTALAHANALAGSAPIGPEHVVSPTFSTRRCFSAISLVWPMQVIDP